ncbi:hypothetical protein CEQ90_04705 [Lewinellaceae bacterium SD302]|nr:hypothetical protein CEQ90_04705 [Lewinellaceae bacterium SD302]
MLYTIGSRVKLRQTGDVGSVSKILGDDLVEVRLDGGLGHIPVPTDSLTYEHDLPPDGKASGGARYLEGKAPNQEEPSPVDLGLEYTILKPWGIQLAFDPVVSAPGAAPTRYRIYLINDTRLPVIFQLTLTFTGREAWTRVGKLAGSSYVEVGELKHNELNDQPSVGLEVRRQLAGGTGPKLHRQLKLKPKQFFRQLLTAPLLNRRVHHYIILPNLDPQPPKGAIKGSLSALTKQEAGKRNGNSKSLYERTPNPAELAAFPREIDLHIESLPGAAKRVGKGKHLGVQLEYFRSYVQRAYNLGVDEIYIIHGIGEGKLRAAVHAELKTMSFVSSYVNEYFERYGNGATRVRF